MIYLKIILYSLLIPFICSWAIYFQADLAEDLLPSGLVWNTKVERSHAQISLWRPDKEFIITVANGFADQYLFYIGKMYKHCLTIKSQIYQSNFFFVFHHIDKSSRCCSLYWIGNAFFKSGIYVRYLLWQSVNLHDIIGKNLTVLATLLAAFDTNYTFSHITTRIGLTLNTKIQVYPMN